MIRKLVRRMLTAQVFSALTVSLCLLIDNIMIGRFLGEEGIAAYGLANPLLLAIGAFGSLLAAGIQVTCSRSLGLGLQEETNAGYSSAVFISAVVSGLFMLAVLLFTSFFAGVMGAGSSGPLFEQTRDYLAGFSIGAPGSIGALVLVPFLQMAGKSGLLIAAVLTMTVTDVALDLLNVLVFHGGMFGMGLASALSYYAAMAVAAVYFLSPKCVFRFSFHRVTRAKIAEIFRNGIPASFSMAAAVILVFLMNRLLLALGGEESRAALAAFTVITSIGNAAQCINTGTGGVSLTLAGILYSEEDRNGLKNLLQLLCRYAVILGFGMGLFLVLSAPLCAGLFLPEAGKAQDLAVLGLRIFAAGLIPCCVNSALKNAYQATERTVLTEVLSLAEGALLPVFFAFLFSRFMGVPGAWLYFAAGETAALGCIALVIWRRTGKKPWQDDAFLLLKKDFGAGPEDLMEVEIRSMQEVAAAAEKAEDFCLRRGQSGRLGNHIALCIEEMAGNTIQHGFSRDGKEHDLFVRMLHKEGYWVIRFRDDCSAFDPVHYLPAEGEESVGIRLVLSLAEEARYTYSLNLNNLTLRLPEDRSGPESTGGKA